MMGQFDHDRGDPRIYWHDAWDGYGDGPVYGPYYGPMIDANPHIKFFDGDRRGYVRCLVDREQWRTDLRMVTTVSRSDAPVYTLESFAVQDGRPGAQPA